MAAMNIFGFCHFTLMIVVTTYFGSFVIVPQLYGNSSRHLYYHYTTIVVLVMNTAGYFINAMITDITIRKLYARHDRTGELLKTVAEQYYHVTFANKKCKVCDVRMPARCHHCALCGICVLKRDHHCFFMCSCIGYHNQKYFIMFCLWQCIAGLYVTYIGGLYLTKEYDVKLNSLYQKVTYLPKIVYNW